MEAENFQESYGAQVMLVIMAAVSGMQRPGPVHSPLQSRKLKQLLPNAIVHSAFLTNRRR